MKNYTKPLTAGALLLVIVLTACGKKTVAPQQVMPQATAWQSAAPQSTAVSKATVLGTLNDVDWYVVITAQNGRVKPLVVRMPSKAECDQGVAEFSLKAVDPTSPDVEPPKAWCLIGKDVRARLGV